VGEEERKLELNVLDELDQLLVESVASYEQKKKLKKHSRGYSDPGSDSDEDYLYAPLDEVPTYVTQFSCAVFLLLTCSHCGAEFTQFSHFVEFQVWSRESSSKPSCWRRVDVRPERLAEPRFVERVVPGCECCCSTEGGRLLERPECKVVETESKEKLEK